jgi:hypothetical protein
MTRDELIAAMRVTAAEKPTAVDVKGLGTVYVRSLTVAEMEEIGDENNAGTAQKKKNKIARSVAQVMCDENGKQLFDPENADDVALLAKQPWRVLKRVIDVSDKMLIEANDPGK